MLARMRARIEAAAPFPRIGVVRIADAFGNRPDMNIAVVNVPALSVMFGSAAGEFGHGQNDETQNRHPIVVRLCRDLRHSKQPRRSGQRASPYSEDCICLECGKTGIGVR
jgi:hypothetical protein